MKAPRFCQWDITDTCNLHCVMCRNNIQSSETSKNWRVICEKIIQSGVEECILAGGEPLTHQNFCEIVATLALSSVKVNVLTNGTLIDDNVVRFLSKFGCSVQVSVDGGDHITHDNIRGKGSFLRTIGGVSYLKKEGINFATKLTLTKLNFKNVSEFVQLSKNIGATSANLRRCIPVGSGQDVPLLGTEELKEAYRVAFLSGNECGIRVSTSDYFALLTFSPRKKSAIEAKLVNVTDTILGGCPIGWTAYYVRWDGKVMFCPYLPIECGDIISQDFTEIWKKSEMYQVSRNFRWNLAGKCRPCKYLMACGGCPAAAYHITGNILGSDPQCWL